MGLTAIGLRYVFSVVCLITVLQVDSLKIALKHLRNENIRLKSQQLKVRYQMNNKTVEYGKNASSTFVKFRKKFRNLRRPDARLPCHWCVSFFIP